MRRGWGNWHELLWLAVVSVEKMDTGVKTAKIKIENTRVCSTHSSRKMKECAAFKRSGPVKISLCSSKCVVRPFLSSASCFTACFT